MTVLGCSQIAVPRHLADLHTRLSALSVGDHRQDIREKDLDAGIPAIPRGLLSSFSIYGENLAAAAHNSGRELVRELYEMLQHEINTRMREMERDGLDSPRVGAFNEWVSAFTRLNKRHPRPHDGSRLATIFKTVVSDISKSLEDKLLAQISAPRTWKDPREQVHVRGQSPNPHCLSAHKSCMILPLKACGTVGTRCVPPKNSRCSRVTRRPQSEGPFRCPPRPRLLRRAGMRAN